MSLFRNIVFISALAGLVAGLAMTFMQYAGTVPLILRAETYENAAPTAPAHDHGIAAKAGEAMAPHTHENDDVDWVPTDGFQRSASPR